MKIIKEIRVEKTPKKMPKTIPPIHCKGQANFFKRRKGIREILPSFSAEIWSCNKILFLSFFSNISSISLLIIIILCQE